MRLIKNIFNYSFWIIISLILGLLYMRLLLGEIPNEDSYNGFGFFLKLFYQFGLVSVGLIIGSIIALLFIITDIFVLKKKVVNNSRSILVRILTLLFITVIVVIFHYFLEKVIDVI